MDRLGQDLAYSWRRLRRAPGFTIASVLILALGIGANTSLFSLVNSLLFKSIPISNLDRIVTLTDVEPKTGRIYNGIDDEDRRAIQSGLPSMFDGFVTSGPLRGVVAGGGFAEVMLSELVSGPYFDTFGVRSARLGRLLGPGDDVESGGAVPVVISERLWRRWFQMQPSAIGSQLRMAGQTLVIVGVAPESFKGTWLPTMLAIDAWVPDRAGARVRPESPRPSGAREAHRVFATLRDGHSIDSANTAVRTLGRNLYAAERKLELAVLPGRQGIMIQDFDRYGRLLGGALLGFSGLVFFIACANLTNLLLARGTGRAAEAAVRAALGASRWRISQLFMTETWLLMTLAGVAGVALTMVTAWIMSLVELPQIEGFVITFDPMPDWRVFLYAMAITSIAAVAIGLVPCRNAGRTPPARVLGGGLTMGATGRGRFARTALVACQVGGSIVLLIGGGLYLRSAVKAATFDPGFETSRAMIASVDFDLHRFGESQGRRALERMMDAARRVPGVTHVAEANTIPVGGTTPRFTLYDESETASVYAICADVSPQFFDTLRIPVRDGRNFAETDRLGAPPVAIVSERTAARLWPGANPVGRRMIARSYVGQVETSMTLEVAGVVADTATSLRTDRAAQPYCYRSAAQHYNARTSILVRTTGNPAAAIEPFRRALQQTAPDVALLNLMTVEERVGALLLPIRITAVVLGSLSVIGFAIALLGLYGVMSYVVAQRTREFGVHKALGASERQIHGMVVRQGVRMLAFGVVPGLVLAFIGAGFLQYIVYGIQARDPLTFALVPTLLVAVGLIACYVPARRAGRVDPSVALRDL
jgi:predicted permease